MYKSNKNLIAFIYDNTQQISQKNSIIYVLVHNHTLIYFPRFA